MTPVAPQSRTTTKTIVAPTVMTRLASVAIVNATARSSTRKSAVICSKFIWAQSSTKAMRTSVVRSCVSNSHSEICPAKARPATRPIVAIVMVNQKDVRTTRWRWAVSVESK